MTHARIYHGSCLDVLPLIEAESVQCIATSPPYFGLRDYGIAAEPWPEITFVPIAGLPPLTIPAMTTCLGLEADPWAYIGHLVGWAATCEHEGAETRPCVVLDPFGGAGTAAMVALGLGRDAISIEASAEHVERQRKRIIEDRPLYNSVTVVQPQLSQKGT